MVAAPPVKRRLVIGCRYGLFALVLGLGPLVGCASGGRANTTPPPSPSVMAPAGPFAKSPGPDSVPATANAALPPPAAAQPALGTPALGHRAVSSPSPDGGGPVSGCDASGRPAPECPVP